MTQVLEHPILKRQAVPPATSLTQAMQDLNILPFTQESVEKYKNKIKRQCWYKSLPYHLDFASACMTLSGVLLMVAAGVSVVANVVFGVQAFWFLWAIGAGVALITTGMTIHFTWTEHALLYTPEWNREAPEQMPEFARQTMFDLQQRCPQAWFRTETLFINERDADPFLVVQGDGNEYYIEVWGEPGFEREYQ